MRFKKGFGRVKPAVWGLLGLLVALAVLGAFTLGSSRSPSSYWQAEYLSEPQPATAIVELTYRKDAEGEKVALDEIWMHVGAVDVAADAEAAVKFSYAQSATSTTWYSSSIGNCTLPPLSGADAADRTRFAWLRMKDDIGLSVYYSHIKIEIKCDMAVNEVAFVDENGDLMGIAVVSPDMEKDADGKATEKPLAHNQSAIADEQDGFRYADSRLNSLSAAESRSVLSAWNILKGKGYTLDETVPPLGQMFIAAGVGVFGANTLGARIVPFLFGVGLVVLLFFFGKKLLKSEWYGLLFAALYVLSGLGYAMMITSSAAVIAAFFVVLAFYFLYEFYLFGIDVSRKFASVAPLLLSAVFFAAALMTRLQSVYALIGLVALFACALVRQYNAHRARLSRAEGEDAVREEGKTYRARLLLSAGSFVAAYAVAIAALTVLCYGIVLRPYGLYYGTRNLFSAIGKNLGGMLGRGYAAGATVNAAGWAVNFSRETLFASSAAEGFTNAAYAFSNIALLALAMASFLYVTAFVIVCAAKKNADEAEQAYRKAVLRPYFALLCGFVSCFLPFVFLARAGQTHFLAAQIFYIGFILLAVKSAEFFRGKPLFRVRGKEIAAVDIAVWALLAVVAVFFALMLSGIAGFTLSDKAARSLFLWFSRG